MRRVLVPFFSFVLVAVTLLACKKATPRHAAAYHPPTPTVSSKPLGNGLHAITCTREVSGCYKLAGEACPNGFDVLDGAENYTTTGDSRATGAAIGSNAFAHGSSISTTTVTREMVVRCKAPTVIDASVNAPVEAGPGDAGDSG